jgi:hypothetical protein
MDSHHSLEWDESAARFSPITVEGASVVLKNSAGDAVDAQRLAERIAVTRGVEKVTKLHVHPSSHVCNLGFLRALPALESLNVEGLQLQTLDGIDGFRRGRFLRIDTGRNRTRELSALASLSLTKLDLAWSRASDLLSVARMRALRELMLGNCPPFEMSTLATLSLEVLQLFGGKLEVLADTSSIPTLRQLTLFGCNKISRFEGNNRDVTWMVVQRCPSVDWSTIATFSGLEHLTIVSGKNILLAHFAGLPALKSLSFQNCKFEPESFNLKFKAPGLEEIFVSSLKGEAATALSAANRGVLISTNKGSFRNGRVAATA